MLNNDGQYPLLESLEDKILWSSNFIEDYMMVHDYRRVSRRPEELLLGSICIGDGDDQSHPFMRMIAAVSEAPEDPVPQDEKCERNGCMI